MKNTIEQSSPPQHKQIPPPEQSPSPSKEVPIPTPVIPLPHSSSLYTKKKVIPVQQATLLSQIKRTNPHDNSTLPPQNSFHYSLLETNNNISNYLTTNFNPEDIINGSSFLNEFAQSLPEIPKSNVQLFQELVKHPKIAGVILSHVKPHQIVKRNGKICFKLFRLELYTQPFLYYYVMNKTIQILSNAQKQYNIRTFLLKKRIQRATNQYLPQQPPQPIPQHAPYHSNANVGNVDIGTKRHVSNSNVIMATPLNKTSITNNNNTNAPSEFNTNIQTTTNSVYNNDNNNHNHNATTTVKKNKLPHRRTNSMVSSRDTDMFLSSINTTNVNNPQQRHSKKTNTTITNANIPEQQLTQNSKQTPLFSATSMTSIFLTKIPQKVNEDSSSKHLDMAYSKAADAARVVRRLEYSYNMKLSMMYSKPIHKKNAKIIQRWWKTMQFQNRNKVSLVLIQKHIRGHLSRVAYKQVISLYKHILPFLAVVDKILSRIICEYVFEKLLLDYAMLKLYRLIKPKAMNIIKQMKKYTKDIQISRLCRVFPKQFIKRCCYDKIHLDKVTKNSIVKIQANIRRYLMHHNDKIMLKYGHKYHPHLFYKLKYKTNIYKKKVIGFHNCFNKVRELNIRANKGVNNKYEYLPYVIKNIYWKRFKSYYNDILNETDPQKVKHNQMKKVLKRKIRFDRKYNIKKYFERWKQYNMVYDQYIKPSMLNKLEYLEMMMKYHKKFEEKIFLWKLAMIHDAYSETNYMTLDRLVDIYHKRNCDKYYNDILNKYYQRWKKKTKQMQIEDANKKIIRFCRRSLDRIHKTKNEKLTKMLHIYSTPLRDAIKSWWFENVKFKNAAKIFFANEKNEVVKSKRKNALFKNFQHLEKRLSIFKRVSFRTYKIQTGMNYRHCLTTNTQISFFHKNRKYFSLRKYRMLKYLINKMNNERRINHWDVIRDKKFLFWKSFGKYSAFKRVLFQRFAIIDDRNKCVKKQKYISWLRKSLYNKMMDKIIYLQYVIRRFIKKKALAK